MGASGVFSLHPTWIPLQGGTRAVGAPKTMNLSAKSTLNEVFFGGTLRARRGGVIGNIFGVGARVFGGWGKWCCWLGGLGAGRGWGRAIPPPGIFF